MVKKRNEAAEIGELLPKFEELSGVIDKKVQDRADRAARNLLVLVDALDESVVHHAKRLSKIMTKGANNELPGVSYSFREDFEFGDKPFAGLRRQEAFAKDCLAYVATQVSGALDPSFAIDQQNARLTDTRGLRDDFRGVAVEAPLTISWSTEE